MSKPKTDGGWLLPAVIDPPKRVGVCVPVPDEPEHRQAFLGALLELARWWNWQRDPLRRGREAAKVWMAIWHDVLNQLQEGEGCETMAFDVRQNEDTPCILEKTDGDVWVPWANLKLCSPKVPPFVSGDDIFVSYDGEIIRVEELPPDVDTITTSDARRPAGDNSDEARCLAALNAANVFRRLHEEAWQFEPYTTKPANVIVAGILLLSGLGVLASSLIPIGAAVSLLSIWLAGSFEDFDSSVERQFACILKNRSYILNGEVYFDFALVRADLMPLQSGLNVWTFIVAYLDIIQPNGLNLAGTTTAITKCCDPCDNDIKNFFIDLTLPENQNILTPVSTVGSTWTWINGTGWRLQGINTTAQGIIKTTLATQPDSAILNFYFRFTASSEPYNWTVTVQGKSVTKTNYRPFGNFYHGMSLTKELGNFIIDSMLNLNVKQTVNSFATLNQVLIQYRGCPPL